MSINSSPRFPATRRLISDVITRVQNVRHAMGSCLGMNQPLEQDTFSHSRDNDSQGTASPRTILKDAKNQLNLLNELLEFQQTGKRGKAVAKAIKSNAKLRGQIKEAFEQDNLTLAKANRLKRKVEKRIDQQSKKFDLDLDGFQDLLNAIQPLVEQTESLFRFF